MSDELNLIGQGQRASRADAVKNHQVLLDTARRLFATIGVENVTMTHIAQEAGVGKGTLYRHFNNKNEICVALLDQEMRELQSNTLEKSRTGGDPYENLRWFLSATITFVYDNSDLLFAGLETNALGFLESPAHLWWRPTIRGFLQQMKDTMGCSLPDDLDFLTDALYVMLGVSAIRFQQNRGYTLDDIINGLHATLERLVD